MDDKWITDMLAKARAEADAPVDQTDAELDEALADYPADTPDAYKKIGAENFWD